jgi:hypothetical protein
MKLRQYVLVSCIKKETIYDMPVFVGFLISASNPRYENTISSDHFKIAQAHTAIYKSHQQAVRKPVWARFFLFSKTPRPVLRSIQLSIQ